MCGAHSYLKDSEETRILTLARDAIKVVVEQHRRDKRWERRGVLLMCLKAAQGRNNEKRQRIEAIEAHPDLPDLCLVKIVMLL